MVGQTDFRLSPVGQDHGISCDIRGAFVGAVPLLRRQRDASGQDSWAPRSVAELNAELGQRYGVPVEFSAKARRLADIASALNRGDVFRAQLATQQLRLPDPPPPGGGVPVSHDSLASQLGDSGILGRGWSGGQAPSLQQGAPGQSGGSAAPNPMVPAGDSQGRVIKAQEFLLPPSTPFEMPLEPPWSIPWRMPVPGDPMPVPDDLVPAPDELGPAPMDPEGHYRTPQRKTPRPFGNPFPGDKECEEEWERARDSCWKLYTSRVLKKGSAFGKNMEECMMGMVSERCGGNMIDATLQQDGVQS